MCAKKTKSTTYNKRHAGRTLSSVEKKKITHSKIATKNASNPFDSFTVKRHMNVKGQRNQTIKLSQAHSRDLQTRRDTLLVELKNKDRSSNFAATGGDDISSYYNNTRNANNNNNNNDDDDKAFFKKNSSSNSSSSGSSGFGGGGFGNLNLDRDQTKLYERSLQKLQKRDLKRKRFNLDEEDSEEDAIGSNLSSVSSSGNKKSKSMQPASSLGATLGDIDEVFDRNMMSALGDDYQDEDDDVEFRNEFAERANRRLEKLQALDAKGKTDDDRYMEIIRKSKLHKIERQKAREEQMDLTDELDDNFKSLMAHLTKRKMKSEREEDGEMNGDDEDDYDKAIRTFSFQARTTPEVLTKTDKETADQRKARLEKLEQERLARMNVAKKEEKKSSTSSVEALDYEEYLSDNDEDIGSDDEVDPTIKLGVPENDGDNAPNMEDGEADKEENISEETKTNEGEDDDVAANIPYLIEAPTNHAELKELLEDRTPKEVAIIFTRIRDLNDPRLGSEQKAKMQVFLSLLIKYFKSYIHQIERGSDKKMPIDFSMLNAIFDHIFGLAEQFPRHAVSEFRNHLRAMHTDLNTRLSTSKDNTESQGYPSSADLILLKLISNVFPVTDFQHPITSAANIYIHQCLADCQIHSLRDVGAALFLCATAIHYNSEAKRYSPEVVNFLTKILRTVSATTDEEKRDNVEEGVRIINWLRVKKNDLKQASDKTMDFNKMVVHTPQSTDKLSLIRCAVSLARTYSEMFDSDLTNYAEIFEGLQSTLQSIVDNVFNSENEIKSEIEHVIQHIRSTSDKCVSKRRRLLYLEVKPQAIPQFTPLIYGKLKGKIVDEDKIRLKNRIMTQKVKKAQRSAIREIRKDNAFLSRAREEVAANDMKQRKEKYKQIVSDLESEKRQQYQLDFGNRQLARDMKQARKNRRPSNRPSKKK